MGVYIFLAAVIVQIVLVFFCIITKSRQKRIRGIVSIGAFAGFVLLVAFRVIRWDFRYYVLAALLLLLAVTGTASLIGQRDGKWEYKALGVRWGVLEINLALVDCGTGV